MNPNEIGKLSKIKKINFFGIGGMRCGSTWLYRQLSKCEQLYLPPMKELHYFTENNEHVPARMRKHRNVWIRAKNLSRTTWAIRKFWRILMSGDFEETKWYAKYFFSNYSDNWYKSLFEGSRGRIAGEITPGYSVLNEDEVRWMHSVAPSAKIILSIRNPVERAWSHWRYIGGGNSEKLSDVIKFLDSPLQELRSNYVRTIELYRKVFGEDRVQVVFFDAISEQPSRLMRDVVGFVGGDPEMIKGIKGVGSEVVNQSPKIDMPLDVRRYLCEKYSQIMSVMADVFGGYARRWVDDLSEPIQISRGSQDLLEPTCIITKSIKFATS